MKNDIRLELSFKNIEQLKRKLNFCAENNIYKINITCKGDIKKNFLNDVLDLIGQNYRNFNVIYHYSFYYQYYRNINNSYQELLKFIQKSHKYKNIQILLISGTKKRKDFDVINILNKLKNEKNFDSKIGVAYNPYFSEKEYLFEERNRFLKKINSGLISSLWLQFGSDLNSLKREINFLKNELYKNNINSEDEFKIYGSLFVPSKQFLARFKFRPWKGVFLSNDYLNSNLNAFQITKELLEFYNKNNICPLIESECCSKKQLEDLMNLLKD